MASLYIKHAETNERAGRVARLLGTTKTEAVRLALERIEDQLTPDRRVKEFRERLRRWRAEHPLGEPTGLNADKAFYDDINGEDER